MGIEQKTLAEQIAEISENLKPRPDAGQTTTSLEEVSGTLGTEASGSILPTTIEGIDNMLAGLSLMRKEAESVSDQLGTENLTTSEAELLKTILEKITLLESPLRLDKKRLENDEPTAFRTRQAEEYREIDTLISEPYDSANREGVVIEGQVGIVSEEITATHSKSLPQSDDVNLNVAATEKQTKGPALKVESNDNEMVVDYDLSTVEGLQQIIEKTDNLYAEVQDALVQLNYKDLTPTEQSTVFEITEQRYPRLKNFLEREKQAIKGMNEYPDPLDVESEYVALDSLIDNLFKSLNREGVLVENERVSINEPGAEQAVNVGSVEEGTISTEVNIRAASSEKIYLDVYEQSRADWLEAKKAHEDAHAEYQEALKTYYEERNNQTGVKKFGQQVAASLGFKPKVPKEVEAMRESMWEATAAYNTLAEKMLYSRARAGKEVGAASGRQESAANYQKVMERYQRLLARTTLTNTFEAQLELQQKAMDESGFAADSPLVKNKKLLRYVGAGVVGTLGAATGGAFAAGYGIARSLAGGAVSSFVTEKAKPKIDSIFSERVVNAETARDEEYADQIDFLRYRLTDGGLTAGELGEIYNDLTALYEKVDAEGRKKIYALMAIASGTGLLFGGAAGATVEVFGLGAEVAVAAPSTDSKPEVAALPPEVAAATAPETSVAVEGLAKDVAGSESVNSDPAAEKDIVSASETAAEATTVAEKTAPVEIATETPGTYTAEKGDNYWDIMEGQTEAGKLSVMEHVSPEKQQELLKLLELQLNGDAALRTELGFGATMDDVQIGATVNTEKLNELATDLAKEEGFYLETAEGGEVAEAPAESAESASDTVEEVVPVAPEVAPVTELAPNGTNPSSVHEFLRDDYPRGMQAFEADFQSDWVATFQEPRTERVGGFLGFGSELQYMDTFRHLESMSVGDVEKIAKLPEAELSAYLTEHRLHPDDFNKWVTGLQQWKNTEGLSFDAKDRFQQVAEAAYITQILLKT